MWLYFGALSFPLFAQNASTIETREPEAATGVVHKQLVAGDKYMVHAQEGIGAFIEKRHPEWKWVLCLLKGGSGKPSVKNKQLYDIKTLA